ncbi:conjugative transposon protein TraN (plasmid) [Adhaeribacter swui]|uniref:Conjugative transposon protein TraN n=1 Tax=Adhaeribacter swui TaxID=2086471 RepID=A0A7G7G1Z7_9BACT|nr:conjugative transposon protein TraN [Adhaeribacter swui]QNF31181.1 conjugative transposon protein TraN [Adhaeribacter swui]
MKNTIMLFLMMAITLPAVCQKTAPQVIYVNETISTHFVSPEPIKYVDISTNDVVGDIPVDNIFRIKPKQANPKLGIVTIVGERFIVQYKLAYATPASASSEVRIDPTQVDEYLNPDVAMSEQEMKRFSLLALQQKPVGRSASAKKDKMQAVVNNIYTIGDYFFIDFSINNKTNIAYDIDQIRFKIEDKKVVKSTNFQQLEIQPVHQLFYTDSFKRRYRNVFVFKKFTFPDEKVFNIEVAEKQVSGRTISVKVDYKDVLKADTL